MAVPNRNLSSPTWTLEEKVKLTAQVLGVDQEKRALRGNVFHRLIDSSVQQVFRLIIPLNTQGTVEEKWAELLEGYLRFGRLSRHLGRIPLIGNRLVRLVSRLVGQMVVRNRFWDISPELPTDLVGLANEYIKFAEGIGLEIDYDKSCTGKDEVAIYVSKCSAGVKVGYPKGTCYAMNEMDREVIRLLGGRLQTTQTIADNGQHCCFRIKVG
jgi:hypothetical protein